jgi:hypothetical protein
LTGRGDLLYDTLDPDPEADLIRWTVAILALALFASGAGAREPHPWVLSVEAVPGETPPPDAVLDRFTGELMDRLFSRGCYEAVRHALPRHHPDAELVLRVTFDRYREETRYFASMIERNTAQDEEVRRALVAEFSARLRIELVSLRDSRRIRAWSARIEESVRPARPGQTDEDARGEARRRAIDEMVQQAAYRACSVSRAKLERKLSTPQLLTAAR